MRNLFVFIARNHAFFLFLLLEAFCIYLIIRSKAYHENFFLNSSNAVTGKIFDSYDNVTQYFYLEEVNDSLMAENAKLKSQLESAYTLDTVNSYTIENSLLRQVYDYIPAKVISSTINEYNNYITLNRGSSHGIKSGMGIIHAEGIVGKVINVSEHYATVMSILHKDSRVSCKILNKGARGTLMWTGNDPTEASLEYVSQPVKIEIGDTVVTTGASTIFPEGVLVGTVKSFNLKSGSNFYNIALNLLTPMNKIQYVYVVEHLYKEEQLNLEKESKVD